MTSRKIVLTKWRLWDELKREYYKLLSVQKSDEDAEKLIISHFTEKIGKCTSELDVFWLCLALCEWNVGRLSQLTKDRARCVFETFSFGAETIIEPYFQEILDGESPPRRIFRKPSGLLHCPWPVGGLLAYRIISSESERVRSSPYYQKYVLLRIVMLKRYPYSKLAPEAAWDESMLVGLYNWVGDYIPTTDYADGLEFTAISQSAPLLSPWPIQSLANVDSSIQQNTLFEQLEHLGKTRIETCCALDWKCAKGISQKEVFTYLGCNSAFDYQVTDFFKTGITQYAFSHSIPFDVTLVKRLEQLKAEIHSSDKS